MKTIIINDYPATFTFKVRKELPEFTFDCPVRNAILHYQLRKQQIDSPCHGYSEYGVDAIEVFEGGEEWIIGS